MTCVVSVKTSLETRAKRGVSPFAGEMDASGLGASMMVWTKPMSLMGLETENPTMADPLGADEGVESTGGKENFIARVVNSEYESEEYGMKEEYKDEGKNYFEHLYELEVLDKDWKNLHEYSVTVSSNFASKWMVLIGHLQEIHGDLREAGIESASDLEDFLEGRVYEFREITWDEDEEFEFPGGVHTLNFKEAFENNDYDVKPFLVPVREITDEDEIADLGEETSSTDEDVEEVELS